MEIKSERKLKMQNFSCISGLSAGLNIQTFLGEAFLRIPQVKVSSLDEQ